MEIKPELKYSLNSCPQARRPESAFPETGKKSRADKFTPGATEANFSTAMDRLRRWAGKIKSAAGIKSPPAQIYDTREGATQVFSKITAKIERGTDFPAGEIPFDFRMTAHNKIDQYAQGAAFSKLKAEIENAIAAKERGEKGVFIAGHNFIIGKHETAKKMTDLFLKAHKAGVPVLFSFDQYGTLAYGKGGGDNIRRMEKAGIPLLANRFLLDRMDHRKIYFIGSGEGRITALTGGQGWENCYAGEGWEDFSPLSEEQGGIDYDGKNEPWMDHMICLEGEAALQGTLSFLGQYASRCPAQQLAAALKLPEAASPNEIKARLRDTFQPEVKPAGSAQALVLTNRDWNNRPITETWYQKISDPRVTSIRIAMPYLTDPVMRKKLLEAVKAGKDLHILIPGKNDVSQAQSVNKYLFEQLIKTRESMRKRGEKTGKLELKEMLKTNGEPNMMHMKYAIFQHRDHPQADLLIDGSYNATALEGRSGEQNEDFLIQDHKTVETAAQRFDQLAARSRDSRISRADKILGRSFAFILRPIL